MSALPSWRPSASESLRQLEKQTKAETQTLNPPTFPGLLEISKRNETWIPEQVTFNGSTLHSKSALEQNHKTCSPEESERESYCFWVDVMSDFHQGAFSVPRVHERKGLNYWVPLQQGGAWETATFSRFSENISGKQLNAATDAQRRRDFSSSRCSRRCCDARRDQDTQRRRGL